MQTAKALEVVASVKFTFLTHHLELKVVFSTLGLPLIDILLEIRQWCWERMCSEKLQSSIRSGWYQSYHEYVKDSQMCPTFNLQVFGFQVVT